MKLKLRLKFLQSADRCYYMVLVVLHVERSSTQEILARDLLGVGNGLENVFVSPHCEVLFSSFYEELACQLSVLETLKCVAYLTDPHSS